MRKVGFKPKSAHEKKTWNENAKPEEEFESMVLEGKDAERFMNEMKKPLTKKQKKTLKRGREVYASIKQKSEEDRE
jgi:hypothetical protein